jgi:hypothetical protein
VTETLHLLGNVPKEGEFWLAESAKQAILWLPNHGRFLLHLKPRLVGAFFCFFFNSRGSLALAAGALSSCTTFMP